jgi:plasmid stabilization system protein ParE
VPRVILTEGGAQGLKRCQRFLAEKNPLAAVRAGRVIERYFELLETDPDIGRPFDDVPEFRELIITFGNSGYVALYYYEPETDTVSVLAFRHQKEAGY